MSRSQWTLIPLAITLTDEQIQHIEQISGVKVALKDVRAWKVTGDGWLIIDEVIGKHEQMTYAVGINANGSVKQIEIMKYMESYGYGVRQIAWRKQFVGKTRASLHRLRREQNLQFSRVE